MVKRGETGPTKEKRADGREEGCARRIKQPAEPPYARLTWNDATARAAGIRAVDMRTQRSPPLEGSWRASLGSSLQNAARQDKRDSEVSEAHVLKLLKTLKRMCEI